MTEGLAVRHQTVGAARLGKVVSMTGPAADRRWALMLAGAGSVIGLLFAGRAAARPLQEYPARPQVTDSLPTPATADPAGALQRDEITLRSGGRMATAAVFPFKRIATSVTTADAMGGALAPTSPDAPVGLGLALGRTDPAAGGDLGRADVSDPSVPDYLTEPPGGLPQLQVGSLGPDRAMDEFDQAFGRQQAYFDLGSLRDRIELSQRPLLNVDASRSTQSNNLDITQIEASQDVFFHAGRDRLRFGYLGGDYSPKVGNGVSQNAFGGDGAYRVNDWIAVTGDLWVNVLDSRHQPKQVEPVYDLFVTLWPNDVIRVDLDANRRIFDNIQSLLLGITADTFAASVDYSPNSDLRVSLRVNQGSYSDNNDRTAAELEGVFRVRSNPVIQIGFRAAGFQFSRRLNDGYFNPDAYESGEGMIRVQSSLNDKLTLEVAGAAGAEHAEPGGVKPIVRASLQLSYKVNKVWTLDGGVAYFSSRDTNSSGFARTTVSAGLHRRF